MDRNNYLLSRKIYRYQTIVKYENKMKFLGYQDQKKVFQFLNTRLLVSVFLFFYFLIFSSYHIVAAITISTLFFLFFTYCMIDYPMKKRIQSLEKDAIYFLEVLILSLDSGKSLIQGLELTIEVVDNSLSKEFKNAFREMNYGKSFHEALINLRKKIPSDILQNVILNISETYTSGGDITNTLRQEIDFIQNKRVMDIKNTMNQIPIKISVVSVFLGIPLVLLLILAPVILEYLVG